MPIYELKKDAVVCSEGDTVKNLLFVTDGRVEAVLHGYNFSFEKGDLIGICDIEGGIYSKTYTAVSDIALFSYPYEGFSTVEALLRDNADIANLIVGSMFRQMSGFLIYKAALEREAKHAYGAVMRIHPQYESLCKRYSVASKKLSGLSEVVQYSDPDPIENWLHDYYVDIGQLDSAAKKGFYYGKPGISLGFLRRGIGDMRRVLPKCKACREYLDGISKILLDDSEHDLFSLVSGLHLDVINIIGADEAITAIMAETSALLADMKAINDVDYQERLSAYKDSLEVKRESMEVIEASTVSGLKQNLQNSLDVIIEYSGCPIELGDSFKDSVQEFTHIPDRDSSDDAAYNMRRGITSMFYSIYQMVFTKSLDDPNPPTIIKMFLNFGYVDAELAGYDNADFLYSIADSLKGDPDLGFYTSVEWLTAVYQGKKEPSRNEFDDDYTEYVREMRVKRKIDTNEEARLLKDLGRKLKFEIENVFPVVNKITYGRVTTFTPLFASHNVQRSLENSQVLPVALKGAIDDIRRIDYSAFYRERLYSNPECDIPKEFLNVEVTPDIILMPNVGGRGIMWQEIEGKNRATPARMFLPMFLQTDLNTILVRLTGEYRWEMCRRIQGPRWNDLADPSLTSEYFDYLQFYRKNPELSTDMKSAIKTEIARANNNYKGVFVLNYAEWLIYESKGSPRLNKLARRLMMDYCPFSAPIREKLAQNPQYTVLLNKYKIKQQKRIKHASNVIQRVRRTGKSIPQELLDELEYANK